MKIYGEGLLLNFNATNITLNHWETSSSNNNTQDTEPKDKVRRIGHYSKWSAVISAGEKAGLNCGQMSFLSEIKSVFEGSGKIQNVKVSEMDGRYVFSKENIQSSRFVYFVAGGQLGVRLKAIQGSSSPDHVIGYFVSTVAAFSAMATYSLCKNPVRNASITIAELKAHCDEIASEFSVINKHLI